MSPVRWRRVRVRVAVEREARSSMGPPLEGDAGGSAVEGRRVAWRSEGHCEASMGAFLARSLGIWALDTGRGHVSLERGRCKDNGRVGQGQEGAETPGQGGGLLA